MDISYNNTNGLKKKEFQWRLKTKMDKTHKDFKIIIIEEESG